MSLKVGRTLVARIERFPVEVYMKLRPVSCDAQRIFLSYPYHPRHSLFDVDLDEAVRD